VPLAIAFLYGQRKDRLINAPVDIGFPATIDFSLGEALGNAGNNAGVGAAAGHTGFLHCPYTQIPVAGLCASSDGIGTGEGGDRLLVQAQPGLLVLLFHKIVLHLVNNEGIPCVFFEKYPETGISGWFPQEFS